MTEIAPTRDLLAAIDGALERGVTPEEIRDNLAHWEGEEWLDAEILARRDDFVFTIARTRERTMSRAAERTLSVGDVRSESELLIRKLRFPNEDGSWSSVRFSDATADQFRRRAHFDRMIAEGTLRSAIFHDSLADIIESQGVLTLGEVTGDLPALPSAEDVRELIAS